MIRISYVSTESQPFGPEQLLALLQLCLRNNTRVGVTGMLIYGNGSFLQTLEGEERVIDALVEKISRDSRHGNMQLLDRRPIETRRFSEWSMGFKRLSDQELQRIEGLRDFAVRDFNPDYLTKHEDVVEALMNHYRAPHWDPLIRELDAKDKVIEHLKGALRHERGCVEIASLVLESVKDASRRGSLSDAHLRLCESALDALRP